MLQLRFLQSDFDQVALKCLLSEHLSIKPCFDAGMTSAMGHPLEY